MNTYNYATMFPNLAYLELDLDAKTCAIMTPQHVFEPMKAIASQITDTLCSHTETFTLSVFEGPLASVVMVLEHE